jgi:hypothetical protein
LTALGCGGGDDGLRRADTAAPIEAQPGKRAKNQKVDAQAVAQKRFFRVREAWLLDMWAIRSLEAPPKLIAAAIGRHFNFEHFALTGELVAWPSARTLDRETGTNVKTVRAAIEALVQCGSLVVERRYDQARRRHSSHLYCAIMRPSVDQGGPPVWTRVVQTGGPDSMNDSLKDSKIPNATRSDTIASRSRHLASPSDSDIAARRRRLHVVSGGAGQESVRAIAFDLAGGTWGENGRAVVGKAERDGVDHGEILERIRECVEEGATVQELAYRLWQP